jgi:S-adenosyl-L-methionine hydrolase (adenosine-forming)
MSVISLMTDFGIKDGNVGVMKGVIWTICPSAQISDLSHMIAAQNVREAALVLARSAPYFPENSVHVVVVDPGVGTTRRPMAARLGNQYYVGPDNGTITLLLEYAEKEGWQCEFVHLDKPEFWLSTISYVFHGRDIFSPVAAHFASGVPLSLLGSPFHDPIRLELPRPQKSGGSWKGEIIHIDHFGNLATNIRVENLGDMLKSMDKLCVQFGNIQINGMVNTFGERAVGELIALLGSTGNLIISVVNGSAAAMTGAAVGNPVEIMMVED